LPMVELVEYSLVFMVSMLFIAGSAVTYTSFTSYESRLQAQAEFASVSSLAAQATKGGNSHETLLLPESTIECDHGSLTVTVGSVTEAQSMAVSCDFTDRLNGGIHVISFTTGAAGLGLLVS